MEKTNFVILTNNPIGVKSLKTLINNKNYSIVATVPEILITEEDIVLGKFKTNADAEKFLKDYKE